MYANRYQSGKLDPASLSLSVSIVGGLIAAALLAGTVITEIDKADPPLQTYTVPPETPPPPPHPKPKPEVEPKARTPVVVEPRVPVPTQTEQPVFKPADPVATFEPGIIEGTGSAVIEPPKPVPTPAVLTGAGVDPRYARDFQPIYPATEQRAGNEGVVTLRVLIGSDGRVRQVERLTAPSDAFWRATESRALTKWRFTPATRDGVAYESWKTMTVRFRIDGER
ncbi:MAG: energy transducer TonB [Sphingomonas bacterium]|uniref:energy transducer TonB n=1 Tax=Sphingomonas bacterium TaxID=1895847 RepID=UPI00261B1466|nr:energy transducer TonB [Sphingomonas bacterium]MDB5695678.1 energy transducer TonB [Sphingomonas bacterium]